MRFLRRRTSFSAFGVDVGLDCGADRFMRDDSLWRVREIFERFLATHPVPREGTAIDIGAGFGAFAIPFALAHPEWRVLCLEPNSDCFHLLQRNAKAFSCTNVVAVQSAVGKRASLPGSARESLLTLEPEAIHRLAAKETFFQDRKRPGFLSSGEKAEWRGGSRAVRLPALPADIIRVLEPTLVKFTCPGHEADVLSAAAEAPVRYVVGESWTVPPAEIAHAADNAEQAIYVPVAGTPLRLRREPNGAGRREGLDVVVAMYNASGWIVECLEGIVGNDADDIHAIVIDDGSTDGCGAIVAERFAGNPRVRVLQKPNGGCASARNYGRLHSSADYIAFVDSDDVPEAELFPRLLELARYSGSPVTQGAFDLLVGCGAAARYEASYEAEDHADAARHPFGEFSYYLMNARDLICGQPTIWRRVYRRDFLDNRNLWFPEHIRAFDDQIFHMLSLHYAETVFCTDTVKYHYRQHPGQDIRQLDERCFHSLEMYRMALKRAVAEGWSDFSPFVKSFVNTINWTGQGIRPDLWDSFLRGAAELWILIEKVFGQAAFGTVGSAPVEAPEFISLTSEFRGKFAGFEQSYAWAYLDSIEMHPDLMRMDLAAAHQRRQSQP